MVADCGENQAAGLPAVSDERRWEAVLGRDVRFDGLFYYAVETTGIYCRPSCPARRPRRNHVSFFGSPAAAEDAGFRPCKRCTPDGVSPDLSRATRISKACRLIEEAEEQLPLSVLASAVGLSPHHFHRLFKAALGITPKAYAGAHRTTRLKTTLGRGASVTEALYEAGFNSAGRFYEAAPKALGMSPGAFRAGGAGEDIAYAIAPCTFGYVLVATSSKGICAIALGDVPDDLRESLRKQFPRAKLFEGSTDFAAMASAVVSLIDGPGASFDLPLDIRGTAFQRQVWEALQRIPIGTTATYKEIAAAIGKPGSSRAVASACAANRLAVAIPCHRVVRSDGSLSGYRWGPARKRAMLDNEKRASAQPSTAAKRGGR